MALRTLLEKLLRRFSMLLLHIRSWYWTQLFANHPIGLRVIGRIYVECPAHIEVGDGTTLNHGVVLNGRDRITIGKHVHLSYGVIINTGMLDTKNTSASRTHISKPVIIHDHVWLASGVIVNPGVTIGEHTIVGAGSVVTKDLPAHSLCYGVPARAM